MADRTVKVTLTAAVNGYIADFQRAQQATKKAGDSAADAAAKYREQNAAMKSAGAGLLVAGAVAVAATGLAVKAAIDWETAWAGVNKTVDGTPAQMAELESSLRSLATSLPATHQEIAAVAEAAGQLGVKREDIAQFTKTMIDLGETTNLSADEAATSLAQLMNVMGTAPDQVDNLGSALVALGNDGASTERDIVQMAQRIAGAGRIVGLTEGEVLGFANALASVGIEAEAGGTAISRIMTDIAISVSEGGEELDKFAAVAGVSSKEFQRAFNEDPADAIATFVEGLGRIDAAGGDVFGTLADLGQSDIRVSQALLGMANSGDLLRNSLELGNTALEENTALTEEAAKRYETTASKLQVVGNKINDAAIDFGAVFLPAITAVAEAVGGLADGFNGLTGPQQEVIAGMVTLATVAALAGGGFLLVIPKIAELRVALGILSASSIPAVAAAATGMTGAMGKASAAAGAAARFLTGPWGLALAAAAVGVAALQQVVDNLKTSTEDFQNLIVTGPSGKELLEAGDNALLSTIKDTTASVEEFKSTLDLLGEGKDFLRGFDLPAQQLKSSLKEVGTQLATTAQTDLPAAQAAFRSLAEEFELTGAEQQVLLDSMGPYKDALTDAATASGRAADDTTLLDLAMGDAAGSSESAAEGYKAAADEAAGLTDQITTLIDAINEANGVGQDAVTANANYQAALAGIGTEVQRQKDAYTELNGSLDGFTLSLDQATVGGSANAAMLADVAGKAQDAALAQFELESKTLGSDAATANYMGTLASQRQAFIDSAIAAGFDADQVNILADSIFRMPSEKEVKILAETAAAQGAVDRFIYSNDGRRINLIVDGVPGRQVHGSSLIARASGGILPGAPSSKDNMLIHAASGEFVVNAAATARNRALLEAINNGGIRGYANGGEVQPRYASSGGGGIGSGVVTALLDPSQMRALSRAVINNIAIDRDAIAGANHASVSNAAWRGGRKK